MSLRISIGTNLRIQGTFTWAAWWATLISATVENAASTKVVMTFSKANTNLVASDFTIAGKTITLLERDVTNKILTLTVSITFNFGDTPVITFGKTGTTANVTNNILAPLNVSDLENSAVEPYNTFTGDGNTGFSVISDGTSRTAAGTADEIVIALADVFEVTFIMTLNSGILPDCVLRNNLNFGTIRSNSVEAVAGANSFDLTAISATTGVLSIESENGASSNYSISNLSVKKK